jgi:chemotaxis protein MotB
MAEGGEKKEEKKEEEAPPQPEEEKDKGGGVPDWMVTFSDLMTLLLTFFVLLLSMADMNAKKYEQMAQSLASAFGGMAISEQNFLNISPATKSPLSISMGTNRGEDDGEDNPDSEEEASNDDSNEDKGKNAGQGGEQEQNQQQADSTTKQQQTMEDKFLSELTQEIQNDLAQDVNDGTMTMECYREQTLLRYPSETTFESGSDILNKKIIPSLKKVAELLQDSDSHIIVVGHTDNIPIRNGKFRSNWDLSASRAVSVAQVLIEHGEIDASRVEVVGRADADPLVPNDTPEHRSQNRRVEIIITQSGISSATSMKDKEPYKVIYADQPVESNTSGGSSTNGAGQ